MEQAGTFYGRLKDIADDRQSAQARLEAANQGPTTFETQISIDYECLNARNDYNDTLLESASHMQRFLPTYIKQAAVLALRDGVEIML